MTKGCVLDLKMSDKQGSVVTDYSRYGNDGAVNGGAVWTEQGMRFDGSTGYLDCGNDASLALSEGTVSLWMKTNSLDGVPYIISNGLVNDSNHNYYIRMGVGGELRFVALASMLMCNSPYLVIGEWSHIVMTFSLLGNIAKIYQDGEFIDEDAGIGTYITPNTLYIAHERIDGHGRHFLGSIDHPQIYNYALPLREIKAHYNATRHNYD